jgi:hypothetical protein
LLGNTGLTAEGDVESQLDEAAQSKGETEDETESKSIQLNLDAAAVRQRGVRSEMGTRTGPPTRGSPASRRAIASARRLRPASE